MAQDFDQVIDRRHTDSLKWQSYSDDVLPMWVADADFLCPPPVIEALHNRIDHGIFGYTQEPPLLRAVLVDHLYNHYRWRISPDALVFLPGVVTGLNLLYRTFANPRDGVLIQTPVYPPFIENPPHAGLILQCSELIRSTDGTYEIDFKAFEKTIEDNTRLFTLCNPHNPVGKTFTQAELERMAAICLKHDVLICSDDIHCGLVYPDNEYLPIASLSSEIENATITLSSPSKTFNIAGLKFSVAIVPNPDLRQRLIAAKEDLDLSISLLAYTAAMAAYQDCHSWLDDLIRYLAGNRDILFKYVKDELPGIHMAKPESTYLGWLDCRGAKLPVNPYQFFLEHALLAFSDGATFGKGGEGFIRLNFACPRSTLWEALKRLKQAVEKPS